MSKKDENDSAGFLWKSVLVGIMFFLLLIILDSCNFNINRATVVKDMGFFMIVEYKGAYYIINENECERGIKKYDPNYVYLKPEATLDKNSEVQ